MTLFHAGESAPVTFPVGRESGYPIKCSHGDRAYAHSFDEAVWMAAHSWLWCRGCKWEARGRQLKSVLEAGHEQH